MIAKTIVLAALLCGLANFVIAADGENATVDFAVLMDRQVYFWGDTPRLIVSAPANLAGRELSLAMQFGNGAIVRFVDPRHRLQADGDGALYTATFRPLRQGDEGTYRYFVTLGGITKTATCKVAGERPNPPLRCSGARSVQASETAQFRVTGGTGAYRWELGATPDLSEFGIMEGVAVTKKGDTLILRPAPPSTGKVARRIVTVTDGDETALCLFEVIWR